MATPPGPAPQPQPAVQPARLYLETLLRGGGVNAWGQRLGRLSDVIVRLPAAGYPRVTGLVADVGRRRVFIPAEAVLAWWPDAVDLSDARVDLRRFERRPGEVLLRADVLGHRLVDVRHARLVRARDLELVATAEGWCVIAVDTHRPRWPLQRRQDGEGYEDWQRFEALIGHEPTTRLRGRFGRLRHLRPAQLADMLEDATADEQTDILSQVHQDPELEADVFEELEDDRQTRLLSARGNAEIADILAHMRADDAADALADLPQERRQPVLELLPDDHRIAITRLLGYPTTTAGGLMGVDYLALAAHSTVAAAIEMMAAATSVPSEALTAVYSLGPTGKLVGAASVVGLVRADPTTTLHTVADPNPVCVHPTADLVDVTLAMADYNLLVLPVVDDDDRIVGVITVDDLLAATIPRHWRNREFRR